MSDVNKDTWDNYVANNFGCPDPIGYLGATKDMVTDLKAFLDNASSASEFQRQVSEYISNRQEFAAFGFHYMESGKFLNHMDSDERKDYPLFLNKLGPTS